MGDVFTFRRGVTSHGLEVFVKHVRLPKPQAPQIVVGLMAYVGMRQEPPELTGLSHAMEHMLGISGSDSGDVSEARRYAITRGFLPEGMGDTDADSMWWLARGEPGRLREMLRFLAQYTRVLPRHCSIEHLRAVHQRELVEVGPRSSPVCRAALATVFPAGHPVIRTETEESIERWTRSAIVNHANTYLTLPNMSLVVAGSVAFPEALRAAEAAFPALPRDGDARRTAVTPMASGAIRCGEFVVHACDVLGKAPDDDAEGGECSIWRMRVTPVSAMHQRRALLCVNLAAETCFATLREKLGIVYAVRPTVDAFRDLRFTRLTVSAAPRHLGVCSEAFRQIPQLVKRRGRKWFEVEKKDWLLNTTLENFELLDLVRSTIRDLSTFGCVQTQRELRSAVREITWADAVAGVEELFAPDRSLMVTIVP